MGQRGKKVPDHGEHVNIMAGRLYDTGEPWQHLKSCNVIVLHFRKVILSVGWEIDGKWQEWMVGGQFKELCQESLQERNLKQTRGSYDGKKANN